MNEVWRARNGIVARGGARGRVRSGRGDVPRGRGSGWRRCRIRARRRGGSTRWPAWSRSRSALLLLPGTTGSPRSGSGSGEPGRRIWPGCALRGIRSPGRYRAPDEKTIRVVLDRLDPRALTRALLGRVRAGAVAGRRRPPCAITAPGGPPGRQRHWPAAGCGRWPWTARPPAEPAAPTAPGFTSWAPPSTAGISWIMLRSTSSTTRPATSPNCWNRWTWPAPW